MDCPDDPPGPKARIGTLVHRLAEGHSGFGRSFEMQDVDPAEIAEALSIFNGPLKTWVEAWAGMPGEHYVEARFRYDAEEDRVFGVPRRDDPNYVPPAAMQMTGEMDFVRVLTDEVEQIDLKTGQARYTLDSQLRGYSLLAQRQWDRPVVRSAFLYAKKTKLEMSPWVEMDVDACDAEAGKLRRTLRTLPQAEPVKGDYCWRCPMGPKKGRLSPCPIWQSERDGYVEPDSYESKLYADEVRLF